MGLVPRQSAASFLGLHVSGEPKPDSQVILEVEWLCNNPTPCAQRTLRLVVQQHVFQVPIEKDATPTVSGKMRHFTGVRRSIVTRRRAFGGQRPLNRWTTCRFW